MATNETILTGKLVHAIASAGSKSEHYSLQLQTEKGSFLLRRKGANPFNDTSLQQYVGKTIKVTGTINDYIFLATEIKEISSKETK